jgi:hypothetical protein
VCFYIGFQAPTNSVFPATPRCPPVPPYFRSRIHFLPRPGSRKLSFCMRNNPLSVLVRSLNRVETTVFQQDQEKRRSTARDEMRMRSAIRSKRTFFPLRICFPFPVKTSFSDVFLYYLITPSFNYRWINMCCYIRVGFLFVWYTLSV